MTIVRMGGIGHEGMMEECTVGKAVRVSEWLDLGEGEGED